MRQNFGQIWVETVIYTLVGLAIIGVLLSIVKPAIDEKKDQIILQQTQEMLNNIDGEIENVVFYGTGNSRAIELSIKKGKLEVNTENDSIVFFINSLYKFSEPNQTVEIGKIKILTLEKTKTYDIFMTLDYKDKLNLTWEGRENKQTFQPSPTPYSIVIKNLGKGESDLINIDIS